MITELLSAYFTVVTVIPRCSDGDEHYNEQSRPKHGTWPCRRPGRRINGADATYF